MKTINLTAGNDRDNSYGIRLKSETHHRFVGKGIHNPSHDHVLQVWENGATGDPKRDPFGKPFTERYSYLWSPTANVIALAPQRTIKYGDDLVREEIVELSVNGYSLGKFQITANRHHDPHMVRVD